MKKLGANFVIVFVALLLCIGCVSANSGSANGYAQPPQNGMFPGGPPPNGMFPGGSPPGGLPPPGDMFLDHSKITRKYLDVAYASKSQSEKLDIYLPEKGDGPFPAIIFIHGGGFLFGDKAENQVKPFIAGLAKGYAVISVNYRLSREAIFPAAIQDVKAAVRFLRANATAYKLDGGRFIAAGGSAGANLVCLLCVSSDTPVFDDASLGNAGVSSGVQAGVSWYAPVDFSTLDGQLNQNGFGPGTHGDADSFESQYLGGQLSALPDNKVQAANPMTYLTANVPPMFIQAGRNDHQAPWQQSEMLANRIAQLAGKDRVQFEVLEEADHIDPLFETDANMAKVFNFMDSAVAKQIDS
jgi:acetyl esterase/lipase